MMLVAVGFIVAGLALGFWIRESNAKWLEDNRGRHHE